METELESCAGLGFFHGTVGIDVSARELPGILQSLTGREAADLSAEYFAAYFDGVIEARDTLALVSTLPPLNP